MNIKYITCSDPREDVPIKDLIELQKISPLVEFGIQAHKSAMSRGMPRYEWCRELIKTSAELKEPLNIAIHVNYQWCKNFLNSTPPSELLECFFSVNKHSGLPTVRRWQFNIGDNTVDIDIEKASRTIRAYSEKDYEFILPYNEKTHDCLLKIHKTYKTKFSVLFDSSYGMGQSPEKWTPPVFKNLIHGYSGGLSDENIHKNLDEIKAVLPTGYSTWIDAEGKLMKPGVRAFDINRAANYIHGVLDWKDKQKN